jgi:conjugal transfer pilus assembly protein TraU
MCRDDLGVPSFGFTMGAWLPYRLFEAVRNPYCMPVFGGIFLGSDYLNLAGPKPGITHDEESGAYYHTHVYSYPLAEMMSLMTSKECNPGGYTDMDIVMMSEFDPVASDDMLALFIYFETAMFANPLAVGACAIECGTLNAGISPQSMQLWWCAGCWGPLYPMTNSTNVKASKHTEASLVLAKELAIKHRRGLGHITYGTENMCGGKLAPFLPKEQYKWQQLFPTPEANKPCCHWTGASEYITGGVSRDRPYIGEDMVHLLFRYTDCCMH